jgi:hypothetical protein
VTWPEPDDPVADAPLLAGVPALALVLGAVADVVELPLELQAATSRPAAARDAAAATRLLTLMILLGEL